MRRKTVLLILALLLGGCSWFHRSPSGLFVSSHPQGKVFLNDRYLGDTPFRGEDLVSGEYTLRIEAGNLRWVAKIRLNPGVLTVVNRELAEDESLGSGEIIVLDRGRGLAIISRPPKVEVFLDGKKTGKTPLVLNEIAPGDHLIQLRTEGYLERTIKVRTREGYRMTVNAQLARQQLPPSPLPLPSPAVEPSGPYIVVKETGTSFGLHVRSGPGLGFPVIEDVKPGEKYPLLAEEKGWLNIRLSDGREGWVSGRYVTVKR